MSKARDKVQELMDEELLSAKALLDMALTELGEAGIISMLDDHGLIFEDEFSELKTL